MLLFKTINDIKHWLYSIDKPFGFVPTMGALHQGHMSLIKESQQRDKVTVVSIFVNPTQFNNATDFEKYPITTTADIELLCKQKVDALFLPTVNEIYPSPNTATDIDIGYLDSVLEGEKRPGHFKGVYQVVHRLLEIIQPDNLYMGLKDYQQVMVIKLLLEQQQLGTNLIAIPTIREKSGLAMSSRNVRLSQEAIEIAPSIYETLQYILRNQSKQQFAILQQRAIERLTSQGFEVEYLTLATKNTMQILDNFSTTEDMVLLIAAWLDGVRLIDNIFIPHAL